MRCNRSDAATGWPWQFFELAGAILLALRPDGRVTYINQKGAETLGHPVQEILDRDWFEHFVPARVRESVRKVFAQVSSGPANAPDRFENPILCRDGSERIIAWRNGAVRDPTGRMAVALSSGEDVTERRAAEAALRESLERQQTIARELDHRIRNLLTVAQAMARQTLAPGPERDQLMGRLRALGAAHGLLFAKEGQVTTVPEILAAELAPYPAEQILMGGPGQSIEPGPAHTLALVIHELTTNAVKHGALSVPEGMVSVRWSAEGEAVHGLELRWTERGGPAVPGTPSPGFGIRLLGSVIKAAGGRIELSFQPDGLQATLKMPLWRTTDSNSPRGRAHHGLGEIWADPAPDARPLPASSMAAPGSAPPARWRY